GLGANIIAKQKQNSPLYLLNLLLFYGTAVICSLIISFIFANVYFGYSTLDYRQNAIESVQVAVEKATSARLGLRKEEAKNWEYLKSLLFISVVLISFLSVMCLRFILIKDWHKKWDLTLIIFAIITPVLLILSLQVLIFIGGV
ncbi:MAG: hypothetical protein KGV56_03265, partial [Gammaproteobacteria bacterium]|nr:hypothetical protein [Gammaproteobacteria bacterium]